jgi:hypothetical protein
MYFHVYLISMLFFFLSCTGPSDPPVTEKPNASIDSLNIDEGNTTHPVYVTIRLDKASADTTVVIVQSQDGTATGGEDFKTLNNYPLEFLPGDVQNQLKIEIIGDDSFEEDEDFTIRIVSPVNENQEPDESRITILNDDLDNTLRIPETGFESATEYQGMDLVWFDEFDEGQNIENNWKFEYGGNGWGNNERQNYRKENATIHDGGYLVIEAREEKYGGNNYTSSRIITKGKFDFKYGRVDIRASLPYGQGIWPALWMLGSNISSVGWPSCGEIDIMELIGNKPATTHGTIHWSNAGDHAQYGGSKTLSSGIFYDDFHVFSVIWDESHIEWLLDDTKFFTADITPQELSEFHKNHFLIFNVAVGGNWPGYPNSTTVFPQRMIVDYIRVFQ